VVRPDSDIFFLVPLEPGLTLLDLEPLESKLEPLLGCPVDVATVAGLREPVRSSALRKAIRV
jgi:predicted nucleotidyltransferase